MSSNKKTAHSPLLAAADSKTASANPTAATSTSTTSNKSRAPSPAAAATTTTTTTMPTTTTTPPIRTHQLGNGNGNGSTAPPPPPPRPDEIAEPPKKADTNYSWGSPAGLKPRTPTDENLVIFRRAMGINTHFHTPLTCGNNNKNNKPFSSFSSPSPDNDPSSSSYCTLEEGRKTAVGIYASVIRIRRRKLHLANLVTTLLYFLYLSQIILGASLTALSASSTTGTVVVTILGAANTVIAGLLALIKGSGQPLKLARDAVEYRKLQDWIEETEALIVVGVIGRDRKEIGVLVESAFRRYNATKESEENNKPDRYVAQRADEVGVGGVGVGVGGGMGMGMGMGGGIGGGKARLG